MNVAINGSRWAGLLVFLGEAAKGAAAVILARSWGLSEFYIALAVVAAMVGTRWSIWIAGSGGRGNTLGVVAMLTLAWPSVVIGGGSLGNRSLVDPQLVLGHTDLDLVTSGFIGPGNELLDLCDDGDCPEPVLSQRT